MTTFYDWKFSSTLLLAFFGLKDKNWDLARNSEKRYKKNSITKNG